MDAEFLPCPQCQETVLVEIPPCADHDPAECGERVCTQCGDALLVGPWLAARRPARRSRRAA